MQKNIGTETSQMNHSQTESLEEMLLKKFISLLCFVTMAFGMCFEDPSYSIRQEPKKLLLNPGETAIINCSVTSDGPIKNIYFRKRFKKIMALNPIKNTTLKEYENRLTFSSQAPHFTFVLKNLTDDDSDFYICDGLVNRFVEILGEGTLIVVGKQEAEEKETVEAVTEDVTKMAQQTMDIIPIIITIIITAICFFLSVAIFAFVKYKKMEKNQGNQNTYVDMRQTLRRDTMQSTNVYCHA